MTIFKVAPAPNRKVLAKQIGGRLKQAREDCGLTQEEVSVVLGIERAAYANIETGRSLLTIEHLMKLPDILYKPVTYFLGVETEQTVEEGEAAEIIRQLPEGSSRQYGLTLLRSWADQVFGRSG